MTMLDRGLVPPSASTSPAKEEQTNKGEETPRRKHMTDLRNRGDHLEPARESTENKGEPRAMVKMTIHRGSGVTGSDLRFLRCSPVQPRRYSRGVKPSFVATADRRSGPGQPRSDWGQTFVFRKDRRPKVRPLPQGPNRRPKVSLRSTPVRLGSDLRFSERPQTEGPTPTTRCRSLRRGRNRPDRVRPSFSRKNRRPKV